MMPIFLGSCLLCTIQTPQELFFSWKNERGVPNMLAFEVEIQFSLH